jgi:hypothetical protein
MSTTNGQGSTAETGSTKSKDSRGTNSIKHQAFKSANNASHGSGRSETGIEELRGYIFPYRTQGTYTELCREVSHTSGGDRESVGKISSIYG